MSKISLLDSSGNFDSHITQDQLTKILNLARVHVNSFQELWLQLTLKEHLFKKVELLQKIALSVKKAGYLGKHSTLVNRLKAAMKLVKKDQQLIILLGGACGTGKSTISAALSQQFNIADLVSTDTIRHILRNFLPEKGNECLFGSTYDCYKKLRKEDYPKLFQETQPNTLITSSFQLQCDLIKPYIEKLIAQHISSQKSLIVEGVHLTPKLMRKMQLKFVNVFPFTITIKNQTKHKDRFFTRCEGFDLDQSSNKYIKNINSIRIIHQHLKQQSLTHQIPVLSNNNIDRSMYTISKSIVKFFKAKAKSSLKLDSPSFYQICSDIIKKSSSIKRQIIEYPGDQTKQNCLRAQPLAQDRFSQNEKEDQTLCHSPDLICRKKEFIEDLLEQEQDNEESAHEDDQSIGSACPTIQQSSEYLQ